MRRSSTVTAIAAVLVMALPSVVQAAPKRGKSAGPPPAAKVIVPNDPAGNYAAYPDWAARALAPKSGGGR